MEIASSGMATYGNSFQQVIGLVTSGTEIMQGRASQVARGLSTIAARIVKNQDALAEYGIQVEKADGSLKSTFDVLSELKPKWDAMTDAQRVALGDTIAGQNQYKVLASVMSNFQHAIDATNTALESAGSAAKENAAYMESLEAKEQALKAEFEDFANRVLSKDVVKGFLEAGTSMLDFANNDVGAAITRIGLLATGMTGLTGIAGQTIGKIAEVGLQLKNLGVGGDSFLGMLASGKVALIVGGVVLAITALVEIIRAVKNAYEEAHPSFEDANKNLQETQTEIQNTTTKLEEYKNKLQELDELDEKDRGAGWAAERAELEVNIQTANAYLEILKQIEQAQLGKVEGSNYITGYTGQVVSDYRSRYLGTEASGQIPITEEQLKAITAEYTTQEEAVMSISLALKDYITGWEDFNDMSQDEIVEELNSQLSALGINIQATTETVGESFESMESLADKAADGFDNLTRAEQDQANQYLADYQTYVSSIANMDSQLDAEQQQQLQTYYDLAAAVSNFDATQATTADTISFVASTFGINASAAADLAAALGYIDPSLTSVASNMVQLSNGAWALKENCEQTANGIWELKDGASELASAVDSVGVTAATAATNLLNEANSVDTTSQSFRDLVAQEIIFNNTSYDVSTKIAALQELAIQAGVTREAIAGISTAGVGGTASNRAELAKEARNQGLRGKEVAEWVNQQLQKESSTSLSEYYAQLSKMMEDAQKNKSTSTGGGSSGKSAEEKAAEEAEKQAKKAQEAQEKAAKESQQAYESAAKSAEQAAQQAAQAAEQAAEEAKQKILDSIQELKDASDDFWDSKTDAIEETNKELDRQKQLEEKLKALEEARQKKILLYKNGQFQYDKDYGTIAKAQADYEETRDKIQRERELEQLEKMKDNATEIFNEMKDIISNGGDVTQEMINNWLSQMQADGVNYYDSNKQMLGEWLDWAKDNIGEFIQSTSETLSGYAASGGLSSTARGAYGTNASTKGEGYLNDPKYWKNGEFVGLSVAWWMDIFERQIKKGQLGDYTTTDAWLGEIPGSSVFDDWKEVLEYWAKKDGGDPYAMQDMLERFEAAQIVLSNYADIFKSLGRTDLADLADKYKDLDVSAYYEEAILRGVAAHPTDPFGWRSFTPAYRGTRETTSSELWQLMDDIVTLDDFLRDYTGLEGNHWDTAMGKARLHADKQWHINLNDESDRYTYATFNTEELKAAYEENEDAIRNLSEAWFNATKDYEREAIHAQAELRREARDRMEELLGYEPSGKSEAERQANRESSVSLFEKKKAQVAEKNTEDIKDYLSQIKEGSNISQKYIDNAREYIGNLIEENSKKWLDLYDQTEKDKLHEQNEQYRAILEQLERAEQVGNVTGGDLNPWEKELENADEWLVERVKELEAQMAANSKAWWETEDEAERKRLHEENERLAAEIDQLTGTTSTYEGHTGTWSWSGSSNARGTHNFMPKGESGISLVGENGPELRVLTRGDNIIPADQTENLWKWSNITPQAVLTTLSSKSSSGNTSYAFDVSRIELPNVTDAKSFVQGLKNYALQYSYKR